MRFYKKRDDLPREYIYQLGKFLKEHADKYFIEDNKAHSWGDFNRWPTHKIDRDHLIMSGEICLIDRMWQGKHAYVICEFYANGDKVKDLYHVVNVDELNRANWRNGYYLLPVDLEAKPEPKLGDPNYSSGHSVDVNGNCNMGCC